MGEKLNIYDFGRELLRTNDLDPVYVILWEARLEPEYLRRWLLAYWCFYHVGTASWITEGDIDYWKRMEAAAGSKDYPRSSERRHFRGQNAINSVTYLKNKGLSNIFAPLLVSCFTVAQAMSLVQEWVGFGPWIAFKVADMLDRLNLVQVEFDDAAMFLFDSPREGAAMLWEVEHGVGAKPGEAEPWAVQSILSELGSVKAPPRYERVINVQEAETILCKWKSYMVESYELGEDIEAVKNGLKRFARCRTSQQLLTGGKRGGLW